ARRPRGPARRPGRRAARAADPRRPAPQRGRRQPGGGAARLQPGSHRGAHGGAAPPGAGASLMCGIVMLYRAGGTAQITPMLECIRHRGPDDGGLEELGDFTIGARRLSIIDVPGGHQPVANEDGTVWVAYNGEIYNHALLRQELIAERHR